MANYASYPLDRPSASVVRPLLDDLTEPDPVLGPVVADPENGWEQLKERLARDLEQDGQVLPIQLRATLAGLGGLPWLTVAAYRHVGGGLGLEAQTVDTVVVNAALRSGLARSKSPRPSEHWSMSTRVRQSRRQRPS